MERLKTRKYKKGASPEEPGKERKPSPWPTIEPLCDTWDVAREMASIPLHNWKPTPEFLARHNPRNNSARKEDGQ